MKRIPVDGDIIIIRNSEFDSCRSGCKWGDCFTTFFRAIRCDSVSNNGAIKGHNAQGKRCYINVDSALIMKVIKA